MYYSVQCRYCGKTVLRRTGRLNESKKFKWKTYCSLRCLGLLKRKSRKIICSRKRCNNIFVRQPSDIKKSKNHYCSHSCVALVNNSKRILKPKGTCKRCGNFLKCGKLYCSKECKDRGETISKEEIVNFIRNFEKQKGRIPFKVEYKHCHAARERFGTWNGAIIASGFDPNPIMFANRHIAKDEHECDSLTEKIIDDWLFKRGIEHKRSVPYPGNDRFTCDFVVKDRWIEFFGLRGEYKRYDELRKRKLKLVKEHNIKLVEIFPKDVFSKGSLEKKLGFLLVFWYLLC